MTNRSMWLSLARAALAIVIGMMLTTLIVEAIELGLVLWSSGQTFAVLEADRGLYFNERNQTWILGSKLAYTVLGAALAGWVATKVAGEFRRSAVSILVVLQALSLVWGGFFSELGSTAPTWLWLALPICTSVGFYAGYRLAVGRVSSQV